MTESREDRLSRIRAAVDDVRAIPPTDAAWLLEQIPTMFEYCVDGLTQIDGKGPYVWVQWDGPYPTLETAEEMAADRNAWADTIAADPAKRYHPKMYRVSRSPAPAWTPIEEDQP